MHINLKGTKIDAIHAKNHIFQSPSHIQLLVNIPHKHLTRIHDHHEL